MQCGRRVSGGACDGLEAGQTCPRRLGASVFRGTIPKGPGEDKAGGSAAAAGGQALNSL